jgi:hypothetical protein
MLLRDTFGWRLMDHAQQLALGRALAGARSGPPFRGGYGLRVDRWLWRAGRAAGPADRVSGE